MQLKRDFIVQDLADKTFLVPVSSAAFSGLVRGNRTFGAVLDTLKGETSEEQIVSELSRRFDGPREAIARDVHTALDTLRKIGALDE